MEVPTNEKDQLDAYQLDLQIAEDRERGLLPMMIVGAAGGTSVGAFDDFNALADVAVRMICFSMSMPPGQVWRQSLIVCVSHLPGGKGRIAQCSIHING